ncbi:Hypothetical predicted protein [Paramuricea clavata]|uniref:Uncharacterized protein n=1 Tax=Paramuricea clavata TaxID=317549 RepID=A0A7D9ELJ3_PARCT|nr:Hypothetical predicted protein [Paramuricea clavata]
MTNIADSVFETETAEISPVKTCEIITNNNPAVTESTPLKHLSWSYNTFTNDMKGVKADITVMQKQITSINNVINSTNAIIESISKVLDSTENRQISYDTRMETLLKEFSIILDEKNRAINERDITIRQLQANLSEIENERNSINLKNSPTKHVDNKSKTASPPMQPLMCQMNNIEDLINLSEINDLCDIETDVLGDASKSDNMLLNACAISSRLSPGTTAYVDDCDEYAISTANADACAVPSDSPPEKRAHADDTSAPISQQCGEDNSGEYDKETRNRTDNPERTIKSTKQVLYTLSNPTIDNHGENKENIGLVSANSIGRCRQNSTTYEQELRSPKTPTRLTNKPRQKPNTKAALQSTNVNNKIKSDLPLPTRSKSQVPEWLSRLPLVEIPVDYSQPPFPKRQRTENPPYQQIGCPRTKFQVPKWLSCLPLVEIPVDYSQSPFPKRQQTKNPPYQHIGCPRSRDWLSYLDFVRQATRTNSKLHLSDRSQLTLASRLTIS